MSEGCDTATGRYRHTDRRRIKRLRIIQPLAAPARPRRTPLEFVELLFVFCALEASKRPLILDTRQTFASTICETRSDYAQIFRNETLGWVVGRAAVLPRVREICRIYPVQMVTWLRNARAAVYRL